jgi:2-polyprenyl-3-methyl-5-hydroxy-6-metoxy-1,4-benzoquinol methylase
MNKNFHSKCLICGSDRLKKLKDYYKPHGLLKCENCAFVFMDRIPTEKELDEHYAKYDYSTEVSLSPITKQRYQDLLNEFEAYRKTNRILDVGCGRGGYLLEAKKRGWEVYGTEFSDEAIQMSEGRGIQMEQGSLGEQSFKGIDFDVITSFEVIEHINNPQEEVRHIHRLLRKGGLFYCTTPNFNAYLRYQLKDSYNVINYPEHLSYYSKKTLKRLFISQEFKPIKLLTTGISISRSITSKKSKQKKKEQLISKESQDEKLRQKIDGKWYLELAKSVVNQILSFLGLGNSLKGYFVKR